MGNVTNALNEFETLCERADDVTSKRIATHMLAFCVRGIFSNLSFAYAHFPTKRISADELFPLVWEAISNIEALGVKEMFFTCDGGAANKKFFNLHQQSTSRPEGVL